MHKFPDMLREVDGNMEFILSFCSGKIISIREVQKIHERKNSIIAFQLYSVICFLPVKWGVQCLDLWTLETEHLKVGKNLRDHGQAPTHSWLMAWFLLTSFQTVTVLMPRSKPPYCHGPPLTATYSASIFPTKGKCFSMGHRLMLRAGALHPFGTPTTCMVWAARLPCAYACVVR